MASQLRIVRDPPRFRRGRGRDRFPAADHWVAGRRGTRSRGGSTPAGAGAEGPVTMGADAARRHRGPDARAQLIVIGAGAAGLWAAARAAELGCEVLVLEKTPRTGTKVLASGGTRCNLTTTLGPREAARLFGPAGSVSCAPRCACFRARTCARIRSARRSDRRGAAREGLPREPPCPRRARRCSSAGPAARAPGSSVTARCAASSP